MSAMLTRSHSANRPQDDSRDRRTTSLTDLANRHRRIAPVPVIAGTQFQAFARRMNHMGRSDALLAFFNAAALQPPREDIPAHLDEDEGCEELERLKKSNLKRHDDLSEAVKRRRIVEASSANRHPPGCLCFYSTVPGVGAGIQYMPLCETQKVPVLPLPADAPEGTAYADVACERCHRKCQHAFFVHKEDTQNTACFPCMMDAITKDLNQLMRAYSGWQEAVDRHVAHYHCYKVPKPALHVNDVSFVPVSDRTCGQCGRPTAKGAYRLIVADDNLPCSDNREDNFTLCSLRGDLCCGPCFNRQVNDHVSECLRQHAPHETDPLKLRDMALKFTREITDRFIFDPAAELAATCGLTVIPLYKCRFSAML